MPLERLDPDGRALAAAGAHPDQVAKLTIHVVDLRAEHLAVLDR